MPIVETRGKLPGPIDFVAVGHLAVDYRDGERVLGGAVAYSCLTATRLGLATAMVTAVGKDFDLFTPLEGIELHYHRSNDSTTFQNEYRGGERCQRLLGRARSLGVDDLAPLRSRLAEDAIVLYCPIAQEVELPLIPLSSRGRCGVAPQGFFRRWDEDGTVRKCAWEGAGAALVEVDVVSMSVTDPQEPRVVARKLADKTSILAVTQGERGARVYTKGRCYRVPAFRRTALDPTGAGDVFAAGLLIALREGRDPLAAAELAT
jgi:sugar/nucleoside kinase (ribokinase family)